MNRLTIILDKIQVLLGGYEPVIQVVEHYVDVEEVEYLYLRVLFPQLNALVIVREYWRKKRLVAYGYYVRLAGYEEWWDNRPHHPEISTHPHHRHVHGDVKPLEDPSLESFLARVKDLLGRKIIEG